MILLRFWCFIFTLVASPFLTNIILLSHGPMSYKIKYNIFRLTENKIPFSSNFTPSFRKFITYSSKWKWCKRQILLSYLTISLLCLEEFQNFMLRLSTHAALNSSSVWQAWRSDMALLKRYRKFENDAVFLLNKAQECAAKLFSLSRRCRLQPKIILPRER